MALKQKGLREIMTGSEPKSKVDEDSLPIDGDGNKA